MDVFIILFLISLLTLLIGLVKPSILKQNSRKKVLAIFGSITVFFFILIGFTMEDSPARDDERVIEEQVETTGKPENQRPETIKTQESVADYKIVEEEDLSITNVKRLSFRVVVPPTIKLEQVRPTIEKIIGDVIAEDEEVDEIGLFIYSDEEIIDQAYDVAKADWAPNGEWGSSDYSKAKNNDHSENEISFDIKENLEEYLANRSISEDKFGLSMEKRKEFFKEFVGAESRAMSDADGIYPVDVSQANWQEVQQKNTDKYFELMETYKNEVINQYGLTQEQADEITLEGLEKNWSMY